MIEVDVIRVVETIGSALCRELPLAARARAKALSERCVALGKPAGTSANRLLCELALILDSDIVVGLRSTMSPNTAGMVEFKLARSLLPLDRV